MIINTVMIKPMVFNTGETQEELRNKYNPEGSDLRKAQLRILDILKYIDQICREQGISYALDSGNVLGAYRHGGFIPWDDDADIIMERKDYKRFCRFVEKHPHPQFVIQNHKTDHHFYQLNSVMRDLKSEYIQDSPMHLCRKYRGMQVDIFPIERGAFRGLHKFMGHFNSVINGRLAGRYNFLAEILYWCSLISAAFARGISRLFGNQNVCMYYYSSSFPDVYSYDDLFPAKPIQYEDTVLMGPGNVEAFLHSQYGDYMNLPPVEMRNHHEVTQYRID